MSIFQMQKEKKDLDDLVKRVEEFTLGAGKIYQSGCMDQKVIGTSLALKIKAGENLQKEILEKAGAQKSQTTVILLEQLSAVVAKELAQMNQMMLQIMEYQNAQKVSEVISEEETLRKLKMGVEQIKRGDGSA